MENKRDYEAIILVLQISYYRLPISWLFKRQMHEGRETEKPIFCLLLAILCTARVDKDGLQITKSINLLILLIMVEATGVEPLSYPQQQGFPSGVANQCHTITD